MKSNQTPLFPKRLRKAEPYPDVSKVAIDDPKYSLRDDSLLVPYEKAPAHPQYKKMALTVGETFYSVNKRDFKLNGVLTKMPNGLYVAWTSCGMCHSHYNQCRCKNGLTCARSIEYIYDHTVADMAGETWDYNHPNYLGSVLQRTKNDSQRLAWLDTPPRPSAAPKPVPSTVTPTLPPKRLRKAPVASTGAVPVRRLRKAGSQPASAVLKGDRLDHRAADAAAAGHADELTNAVNRMLDSAPRKRIRKAGSQ